MWMQYAALKIKIKIISLKTIVFEVLSLQTSKAFRKPSGLAHSTKL